MRISAILFLIITSTTSYSYSQNWTGAINSDWNNAANWSNWPLGGQDITINPLNFTGASASPVITSHSVFIPGFVLVTNGGHLTINANLTTLDDVECIGLGSSITVNAGTFSVNPGDGGRLIFDLGATGIINAGNVIVDERFIAGENALVTINGGTSSSGERLIMDLGGQFIQYGGTVNVAALFAAADGSMIQQSGYTLNNGILNITGEFALECETGNFNPFFIQNNGTLNVNGDIFWFGMSPGIGRGIFIQNGGISNISGIIQNMPASTIGMHVEFNNNAVCNITGTLFENLHQTDSLFQTGTSQINISQPSFLLKNQGKINAFSGLFSINGNCSFSGTGMFQFDDINLQSNSTLVHNTLSSILIRGNFLQNGNYIHQNHKLIFNGNDLQNVSGFSNLNAYKLTILNDGQGVQLATQILVNDSLTLSNGVLHSSTSAMLTILENGSSSAGSMLSYVSGPMKKIGNTSFIFPVGKNGKWARIGITSPNAASDAFIAEYFNNAYSSLAPVSAPLSAVSGIEYWNLSSVSGNAAVKVQLHWEDANTSAIFNCNEFCIAKWNGSSWISELATSSGSCNGNDSGSIQTIATLNTFGNFTFGYFNGVSSQQFEICDGNTITVGGSTYSNPGTYIDVFQDINNNDSIVITSIVVIDVNAEVQFTAPEFIAVDLTADSYQWVDCNTGNSIGNNSIVFNPLQSGWYALVATKNNCSDTSNCFHINIIDTTICQGETISIGTNNYLNQGVYHEVLTSFFNQDSIIRLTLDINLVDTSITLSTNSILSNNINATSFQWYDCNSSTNILNESSNVYNYTSNGSYALIVEENGCIDTSNCIQIMNVGIDPLNFNKPPYFFPNPTTDNLIFSGLAHPIEYTISTLSGKIIQNGKVEIDQTLKLHISAGTYIIQIMNHLGTITSDKLVVL